MSTGKLGEKEESDCDLGRGGGVRKYNVMWLVVS